MGQVIYLRYLNLPIIHLCEVGATVSYKFLFVLWAKVSVSSPMYTQRLLKSFMGTEVKPVCWIKTEMVQFQVWEVSRLQRHWIQWQNRKGKKNTPTLPSPLALALRPRFFGLRVKFRSNCSGWSGACTGQWPSPSVSLLMSETRLLRDEPPRLYTLHFTLKV